MRQNTVCGSLMSQSSDAMIIQKSTKQINDAKFRFTSTFKLMRYFRYCSRVQEGLFVFLDMCALQFQKALGVNQIKSSLLYFSRYLSDDERV